MAIIGIGENLLLGIGIGSVGIFLYRWNPITNIVNSRGIVTQVGFCVISPWFLSRFHQKALLRWLLHLHSNFQLIP